MFVDNISEYISNKNFNDIYNLNKHNLLINKKYSDFFSQLEPLRDGLFLNLTNNKRLSPIEDGDFWELINFYGNSNYNFLPLVEIPREISNLVFCIDVTKFTTYDPKNKNEKFNFNNRNEFIKSCKFLVVKIYKFVCEESGFENPCSVYFYVKQYKTRLVLKIQFSDFGFHQSSKIKILENKKIKETFEKKFGYNPYIEYYNEIFETTFLPNSSSWKLFKTYQLTYDDDEISFEDIKKKEYKSINSYTTTINLCDNDNDEIYKSTDIDLTIALLNDFKIQFYNLILKYLDEQYYNTKEKWIELLRSFKKDEKINKNTKLLLLDFSLKKIDFIDNVENEFFKEWHNYMFIDSKINFYLYTILESDNRKNFKKDLKEFLLKFLEVKAYKFKGMIKDLICATILSYNFYGKYFSVKVDGKIKVYEYIDKYEQSKPEEIFKWRELSSEFIIDEYIENNLIDLFEEVLNKIEKINTETEDNKSDEYKNKIKNLKKLCSTIEKSKTNLTISTFTSSIKKSFFTKILHQSLLERLDRDPDVVGVKNGILYLDIKSTNPKPQLYKCYSPYYVSKSANANYIEYDECIKSNPYIKVWEQIYRDSIIEEDARIKIQYFDSSGLDNMSKIIRCLEEVGCGANGKSVRNDNILYVLGNYAKKSSMNLLTKTAERGKADPEFMFIMGARFILASESNKGDKLSSSALKILTEKYKSARDLFKSVMTFEGYPTLKINTNFELDVIDFDNGTWRRIYIYNAKVIFNDDPDLTAERPYERKKNAEYEELAMNNQDAADALFSLLVHWRCEFQRLYKSDIDLVPSHTIDEETNNYRKRQDSLTSFIQSRIVNLKGFKRTGKLRKGASNESIVDYYLKELGQTIDLELKLENVIREYNDWYKRVYSKPYTSHLNAQKDEFKNSMLGKYISKNDHDEDIIIGKRCLSTGQYKLKEEIFLV